MIYDMEANGSNARIPAEDWGYLYPMDFVLSFGQIWKNSQGAMTLTGSYVQDREEYPGFWEHDMLVYLNIYGVQERTVQNTLKRTRDA